ncbi:4-alpha-glucanotransferase [Ovoidimarina sediminis]|uniref:4-alpha-glucanotransferase n=1 Tax=Ovoidimarina sediminis TaxID=3079856 RepID=UPI002915A141|nr:4-alpha-glucanotransferase [Rhodophyticola sp. MJ-SS7]MDU8943018.1 4-alpha-glucanotransferase [Rhodophyticola sp. MJ-SS7]
MSDDLSALARLSGVQLSYTGQMSERRAASPETLRAVLAAMGHATGSPAEIRASVDAARSLAEAQILPPYVVAVPGTSRTIGTGGTWTLTLEDGTETRGRGPLPPLPVGRHSLVADGARCWILTAPARLPLPKRGWGVTAPLYGLRGPGGGLADYADLAEAARALAAHGAGFLGINPVHAGFPSDPAQFSPYSPSHRRRLSVAHLAIPGDAATGAGGALIDYATALPARLGAARRQFEASGSTPEFDAFLASEGARLTRFATYQALAQHHGPHWSSWPAALRSPDSPDVRAFAAAHQDAVRFHAWLQFLAHEQLSAAAQAAREAGMAHGLYLDLAVGTHPHGAETWSDPEGFAKGVSLGAPPDAFSKDGQTWNVAPFNPRALIASGFAPLAATLRAQLRYAGMLRVDHILGFERAFWVPDTGAPGAYVTMPKDAMLAVLRIEAHRVGAVIVGEDLGNIPEGLQHDLAESGILGCDVAQFMPGAAAGAYREAALASFGTHDLPTWSGWQDGRDIDARVAVAGLSPDAAETAHSSRARDVAKLLSGTGGATVDALHGFIAASSARLVALQLEDILEVADQPNLPGTVDEYPNWRRTLPVAAQNLAADPRLARAARIMQAASR